jgi:heat shock protein 1/8
MSRGLAIGIDLGTTYSCVAILRNGIVEIIANEQGNRTCPSVVGFTDTERLVGESAKNQIAMNPTNTVSVSKRLIGRTYDDPEIQKSLNTLSYEVVNKDNKILIKVDYKNEVKHFTPEEISGMVLSKMKNIAEDYLGESVTNAVITVPAYFNDSQRQATKDAGVIAGLNVLRIINEPTASAIAYGLDNKSDKERKILVFDYGGGTHDVSVLTIDDGVFEVKATGGDCFLGGEDLDQRLIEHCCADFKKKYKLDVATNPRALRRLKTACESAKRTLSSITSATIEIDSLLDGNDCKLVITRAKFEDMCSDLFRRTIDPVDKVLKDSGFAKSEIDDIVLVGGSTRIPKIQKMLSEYFNGKEMCKSVNPDEAVAYGAAVQAAVLTGNDKELNTDILLIDVTPLSLGIETSGQVMTNIVDRNTTIPCRKDKIFSTYADNQPAVTIKVYEGERPMTKHNHLLGEFTLTDIPLLPRGQPQIEVSFDVDSDGILKVTAIEKSSGKTKNIEIKNESGRLSKDQIEKMVKEAETYKEEDDKTKDKVNSKNELENNIYRIKNMVEGKEGDKFSEDEKVEIQTKVKEYQEWVETHTDVSVEEYKEKDKEVQDFFTPLVSKAFASSQSDGEVPLDVSEESVESNIKVEEVD